jgi:hypothetical protein
VEGFRDARKPDGERYANSVRRDLLSKFFQMLDFGRRAGLLDRMAGGFARQQSHNIPSDEANEDEVGKAIPESVIAQLDAHLDRLGDGFPYGAMAPRDVHLMFRTAYTVLRDTGRRPIEVTSLKSACLEAEGGEFTLVWDNHKKKRYRRRLPITKTTATAIQIWQQRRQQIGGPAHSRSYLFPAISEDTGVHHLLAGNLARAIRSWADDLPVLDSEVPGATPVRDRRGPQRSPYQPETHDPLVIIGSAGRSGGQRRKLRVGALGDQGEDAAGGGQVFGRYLAPDAGADGGGLRADGGDQLAPCIRGAKARAIRDEQLLGQQLVESGADIDRIGLEGAPDLGDEIVRRLRGVGGDGGAQGDLLLERGAVPGQNVLQDAAGGVVGQAEGACVGDGCGGGGCGGGHGVVP